MVKKSFRVTICFDLHQVTCPGVWLCPKGKIFITVSLFKCLETTKQVRPVFPLKFHQRFVFDKIFDSVSSLGELECGMSNRNVRLELVQVFKGKLKMITLGVFQAPLTSVLYPSVAGGSDSGAAEVDLLFESCQPFPGIIAPKAEVSTRAVIEELRLCPKFTEGPVNPTLVASTMKFGRGKSRQRSVCHNRQKIDCACCKNGKVMQTRPKTTATCSSPPAISTKCKGIPPYRPKTIEGENQSGTESDQCDDIGCQCSTSQDTSGQDSRLQNNKSKAQHKSGDIVNGKRSGDENFIKQINSREGIDKRQKSLISSQSQPYDGLIQQTVQVDVHANPTDNSDLQGDRSRPRQRRSSNSSMEKRASTESDQISSRVRNYHYDGVGNGRHSQQEKNGTSQQKCRSNQETQYYNETSGKKEDCDCITCDHCKKTMERLLVPWKVYAAPESFEHCFYHSRLNEKRNQKNNYGGKSVENQSATTQTSAICRCQEPDKFSTESRPVSKPDKSLNANKNEIPKRNDRQKDVSDMIIQQMLDKECEEMPVKFICPCGGVDMTSKQNCKETIKRRGVVEQRVEDKANAIQERRSRPSLIVRNSTHNKMRTADKQMVYCRTCVCKKK